MWFRNKKGMEMKTIIKIALLTLAFLIIIGLFNMLFASTKEKGSEELCHTFNAITAKGGSSTETAKLFGLVPTACQVLEVEDIPTKSYTKDKEGAMQQIGDLSAKCWWMFLEGTEGVKVLSSKAFGSKSCFICYTFNLNKDVSFTGTELDNFFDNVAYTVKDESDKCGPTGGGTCALKCEGNFSREIESAKCDPGKKCCMATDKRNECVDKGGRCLPGCSGEYSQEYAPWQCAQGRCCLKPRNFFTYRDYIQRFGGAGAIEIDNLLKGRNFTSTGTYAIVFTEDTALLKFGASVNDGIQITELNSVQNLCSIESAAVR